MTRLRFLDILIVILTISILNTGCGKSEEPVSDILAEIDSLEKKLEWADYRLSEEEWEHFRTGKSDSLSFYNDLYLYVIAGTNLYKYAKNGSNLTDKTDRQRLQILISEIVTDRIEFQPEMSEFKRGLKSIVDSFKVDFQGEETSLKDVKELYYDSRNRSQRELGCRAWYSIGENLAPGVYKLIRARNETASRLGYDNYWDLVSSQFSQNGVDILAFIKSIDSLTQSPYTQYKDNARTSLGVNQLELWDIPFTHSQINRQGDSFFPIDSQFTFVRRGLTSVGFSLEQLPIYIEDITRADSDFESRSFAVSPPHDIRILNRVQNGFAGMHSLLNQTGISLYSAYIAQERPLYNYAADTTWQMAMGEIISAMANDSAWLYDVASMPVGFISQFKQAKIEQELIIIRELLANINFIYEAHINPDRDLNLLYWELYQKFTGLPRHEDMIIWSTVPELTSDPMLLVRKLAAKTIAAQSVNYMTTYFGPLINNHNTSSFLVQNYFRFGSRYAWSELLQRGTGEKLNPIHLKKFLEF